MESEDDVFPCFISNDPYMRLPHHNWIFRTGGIVVRIHEPRHYGRRLVFEHGDLLHSEVLQSIVISNGVYDMPVTFYGEGALASLFPNCALGMWIRPTAACKVAIRNDIRSYVDTSANCVCHVKGTPGSIEIGPYKDMTTDESPLSDMHARIFLLKNREWRIHRLKDKPLVILRSNRGSIQSWGTHPTLPLETCMWLRTWVTPGPWERNPVPQHWSTMREPPQLPLDVWGYIVRMCDLVDHWVLAQVNRSFRTLLNSSAGWIDQDANDFQAYVRSLPPFWAVRLPRVALSYHLRVCVGCLGQCTWTKTTLETDALGVPVCARCIEGHAECRLEALPSLPRGIDISPYLVPRITKPGRRKRDGQGVLIETGEINLYWASELETLKSLLGALKRPRRIQSKRQK